MSEVPDVDSNRRELAIRRIRFESSESAEPIYDLLADSFPVSRGITIDRELLRQPISSLSPGTLIALREVVDEITAADALRLVAALCERFEAELTDWDRVPTGLTQSQGHVLSLGLFLAVVLIPLCHRSRNADRAARLTLLFAQQMCSSGYDRVPLAGGDGLGDSTLAILMLPLAALCEPREQGGK